MWNRLILGSVKMLEADHLGIRIPESEGKVDVA